MSQFKPESGTTTGRSLVALSAGMGGRPVLARADNEASFISQLIAERQHLPPQRQRRRASFDFAVDVYRSGAAMAVVRMPQGYRTTKIV